MNTTTKLTKEDLEKIKTLATEGKMDSEIAKELSVKVCTQTIANWRNKFGIKSKFTYDKISKIKEEKLKKLFSQGLSDYAIAKELRVNHATVFGYRKRHGYVRKNDLRFNKKIPLTQMQKEVLIGTLLGDSSLRVSGKQASPSFVCMHGVKQKDYTFYKAKIFESLEAKVSNHKRKISDKRNGNFYEDYTVSMPANPAFRKYYTAFYKNGKKHIPSKLLKDFTAASLAFMYMDDGSKMRDGYQIATMCFNRKELNEFRIFLLKKFALETSLFKSNVLYIKKNSVGIFTELISPYVIDCMKYKLHVS